MNRPGLRRVLSIAGSDSGGGAGIQADLKTFSSHRVYGMTVVTALTAQNTLGVQGVQPVPPGFVVAQMDSVFSDLGVDAIKIGMLASAAIVRSVARSLTDWLPRLGQPPVVLDPVMVAQSGDRLLDDDAVAAIRELLLPLATLLTPNLPEASRLLDIPVASEEEQSSAARALARMSPGLWVLVKGGHRPEGDLVDVVAGPEGEVRFAHQRVATRSTHGTGCTLSSAIAARMALGAGVLEAIGGAIDYLERALMAAPTLGHGQGPVDHLVDGFPGAG